MGVDSSTLRAAEERLALPDRESVYVRLKQVGQGRSARNWTNGAGSSMLEALGASDPAVRPPTGDLGVPYPEQESSPASATGQPQIALAQAVDLTRPHGGVVHAAKKGHESGSPGLVELDCVDQCTSACGVNSRSGIHGHINL